LDVETYWPWGPSVGDVNADGWDDIFIASGMSYPYRYGINSFLLNDHGKKFVDAEFVLGVELRKNLYTRGLRSTAPTRRKSRPRKSSRARSVSGRVGNPSSWHRGPADPR
jgi:hypothetical protein